MRCVFSSAVRWIQKRMITNLSLSSTHLSALHPSESIFPKQKTKLEAFFSWILKLEFIVMEMESPMIDRLACCFSAVYPLPCVQESKSWQSLSDFWMRTNEHIYNQALCSSRHLLQAVVYMLMLDSVTPARPNHFLSCCWSYTAGFVLILTPIQFDRNVTCDDLLSRASVRSWYLLNLIYLQRSVDYRIYFTVASGETQAETKLVSDFQSSFTLELQGSLL